jgi:hypothetical protein
MKKLSFYRELANWIFLRLPITFSLPFAFLIILWVDKWYSLILNNSSFETFLGNALGFLVGDIIDYLPIPLMGGIITIFVFLLGIFAIYNVSVLFNLIFYKSRKYGYWILDRLIFFHNMEWFKALASGYTLDREIDYYKDVYPKSIPAFDENKPKIGIILAGGGAKGAYQAGAMAAIYEYLKSMGMLSQVRMIAGTSIGSWNSLFWVAGLMEPNPDDKEKRSFHQVWWEHINIKSTIMPWFYIPFFDHAFLSTQPWQDQFEKFLTARKERGSSFGNAYWTPMSIFT